MSWTLKAFYSHASWLCSQVGSSLKLFLVSSILAASCLSNAAPVAVLVWNYVGAGSRFGHEFDMAVKVYEHIFKPLGIEVRILNVPTYSDDYPGAIAKSFANDTRLGSQDEIVAVILASDKRTLGYFQFYKKLWARKTSDDAGINPADIGLKTGIGQMGAFGPPNAFHNTLRDLFNLLAPKLAAEQVHVYFHSSDAMRGLDPAIQSRMINFYNEINKRRAGQEPVQRMSIWGANYSVPEKTPDEEPTRGQFVARRLTRHKYIGLGLTAIAFGAVSYNNWDYMADYDHFSNAMEQLQNNSFVPEFSIHSLANLWGFSLARMWDVVSAWPYAIMIAAPVALIASAATTWLNIRYSREYGPNGKTLEITLGEEGAVAGPLTRSAVFDVAPIAAVKDQCEFVFVRTASGRMAMTLPGDESSVGANPSAAASSPSASPPPIPKRPLFKRIIDWFLFWRR